ncbi:hypothetical protein ACFWIQ_37185 [Kitasatospora sp. NPDC127059]|uniref:hypothetical protein n=1 Tax=unclassified Kitasatospora TaxID=2633591 RepID=UPI003667CD72
MAQRFSRLRALAPVPAAVRPPRLTGRPGRGRYGHAVGSGPAGPTVPRADVARAMLDLVTDPTSFRHAVGLSP